MQIKIRVKGWPAIIVLAVFLGGSLFLGWYRYHAAKEAIPDVKEQARLWVVADRAREIMPASSGADLATLNKKELARLGNTLEREMRIEITSVELRGSLFGKMVLRVEYTVDGKPPKDGGGVRYYSVRYSFLFGMYQNYKFHNMYPLLWHLAVWR